VLAIHIIELIEAAAVLCSSIFLPSPMQSSLVEFPVRVRATARVYTVALARVVRAGSVSGVYITAAAGDAWLCMVLTPVADPKVF